MIHLIKFLLFLFYFSKTNALYNPVLLLSFDGMKSEKFEQFLSENPSSNFNKIIQNGLKADYMQPSFPSFTFPNHITLVTGLYPESHGIVSNTIYDPIYKQKVRLPLSKDIRFWNKSEPIWYTAKKQGLHTASSFWVGNDIWPRQPDIFLGYNQQFDTFQRVDELINWYKKFKLDLVLMYFDEPDMTGHKLGPDSKEYMEKILLMDKVVGYLLDGLKRINLLDKLNIIIVGDHGMASLSPNKSIVKAQDYINVSLIDPDRSVFGIVSNVYPKSDENLLQLYELMKKIPNQKIYLKENVPEEFHYRQSERIAPIVVVADEGFGLSIDETSDKDTEMGAHGYNNSLKSMRTIFLAQGPNFEKGKIGPFKNINIYPLICKLLQIKCHLNNGTTDIFEPFVKKNYQSYVSYVWNFFRESLDYLNIIN